MINIPNKMTAGFINYNILFQFIIVRFFRIRKVWFHLPSWS
jgi:hypothetical protein